MAAFVLSLALPGHPVDSACASCVGSMDGDAAGGRVPSGQPTLYLSPLTLLPEGSLLVPHPTIIGQM